MYLGDNQFGLQPVWEALIKVYLEFAKICDRHHLRYYVTDGSALGAVRHGGFIPWDDDFDVSMPRPDYEKFLVVAKSELPANLKVVTWRNTPEYNYVSMVKVQETRREYVLALEQKIKRKLSNGIFIDVFPINGCPTGRWARLKGRIWFWTLRLLLRFHCERFSGSKFKHKIAWLLGMSLAPFLPWLWTHDQILGFQEKILSKLDYDKAEFTGRYWMFFAKPLKKCVWGRGKIVPFGEMNVPLPSEWHEFLTVWYGDYMKMPPESEQHPTHSFTYRCPWWLGPTREDSSC